ncbi:MAG: hypothetical protein AAGF13_05765 [Pseudomonadota bacterium]
MEKLKTWSLIVTLFGDLDGEELSGTQIREILGHIGVKPEAIRVALHRLKADGWITSSKQGRGAAYRMSKMARAETEKVAPDVYHRMIEPAESWHFLLFQDVVPRNDVIILNKNLAIAHMTSEVLGGDALVLTPQAPVLPDWVAASLVSERVVQLAESLRKLVTCYPELSADADKVAFRLLVLHHWRRIALRQGSWAHASFVPDGPIACCHRQVSKFFERTGKALRDI